MRILVAEDNEALAAGLSQVLRGAGYAVDIVVDGPSADAALATESFDLAILDLTLPGMDGLDVLRALRARRDTTAVMIVTARGALDDRVRGLDLGADDYLTKPFSVVVLIARLRALARRGAPERPAVLSAGDLHLDPAAHTVHRGDTELGLTPREFAVLEDLMRHKGQVRSKADILASVWDAEVGGDDNLVEVYISYLRRRVDAPFGRKAIETVRGHGYRLAADGGAHTS